MKTTTIFLLLLASAFQLHAQREFMPEQSDDVKLKNQLLKTDYSISSKNRLSDLCELMKKKTIGNLGICIYTKNHFLRKIRHQLVPCYDIYKATTAIQFLEYGGKDLLELKRYPNLELLDADYSSFVFRKKDKGCYLRRGLKGLDKLKFVEIRYLLDIFPEALYAQKNLSSLLIGFEADSLSKPLELPNLFCLQMYCPNFKKIPESILNSPCLQSIMIINKGLFHSLPVGIAKLQYLKGLVTNVDTGNMENINTLNQIDRPFTISSYLDDIYQISPNIQYLHPNIKWEFHINQKETLELQKRRSELEKLCPNIDIRFGGTALLLFETF